MTPSQIKNYFPRLASKERSSQSTSASQTPVSTTLSSSSSMDIIDPNNMKSNNVTSMDESNEIEDIDDKELEVYLWRQVLDEARVIINSSSIESTTASSSSTNPAIATTSSKRKLPSEN